MGIVEELHKLWLNIEAERSSDWKTKKARGRLVGAKRKARCSRPQVKGLSL